MKLTIKPYPGNNALMMFQKIMNIVFVDGSSLEPQEIDRLALNDGFDGVKEFLEYFKEGFVGKIIHWTDFKY